MIRMDQAKKEKLRDFFNQFFDDADNDDISFLKAKEKLKEMRKKLRLMKCINSLLIQRIPRLSII